MEQTRNQSHQIPPQDRISGQDVPRVRDVDPVSQQTQSHRFVGVDPADVRDDPLHASREAERQERAEIAAGHDAAIRFTGRSAKTDKLARVYAKYDPSVRHVQPAEFYRFVDPEIETFGHF